MRSFLADVWRFTIGRGKESPIYRHEIEGWSYIRVWSGLRRGCLPLLLVILLGGLLCGGSVAGLILLSGSSTTWDTVIFSLLIGGLIGMMAAGEMVRWVTGLLATVLSATTISAEVEAQTFGLLRLTDLSTREIVLAKFGATFRQFHLPLMIVAIVRVLFVVGMAATVGLFFLTDPNAANTVGPIPSDVTLLPWQSVAGAVVAAAVIIAVLVWLLYYFTAPTLRTFTFATLGIFASSLAKTRGGGLMLALAMRAALWIISYIGSQVASVLISLLATPLALQFSDPAFNFNLDPLQTTLAGALSAALGAIALVVVQVIMGLVALRLTVSRAERLPRP